MSEGETVEGIAAPRTRRSLAADLLALGLHTGDTVIVHSSLSAIGWVAGGPVAVIQALCDVLGERGNLVMPTQSAGNTDPADWIDPPVPASWWPVIRQEMPAYDPARTPTRGMGSIPELFRTWPGVLRSAHPAHSFAALGPGAEAIISPHALDDGLGEHSPLARLYTMGARILLLGVGHESNTSLHLAEYRAPVASRCTQGASVMVDGLRRWVTYSDLEHLDTDEVFPALGTDYEAENPYRAGPVGSATCLLLEMPALVDFAVPWIRRHLAQDY